METIVIIAQTKASATIGMLVFLLVAAVIGYLTSYFYYKAIYMKKIQALESEIEGQKKEIINLEIKVSDLENNLSAKDKEIQELKKKNN